MTDLPSPCKVAKGDGPFVASLIFPAQPVEVEEVKRNSISLTTTNFEFIDILAPPAKLPDLPKKLYYILDDGFLTNEDCDMTKRKKSLVSKLISKGKETGCRYYTDGSHQWGAKEEHDNRKGAFRFFKLCCSHSRVKSTKDKNKKKVDIKLASTNNTRVIHGRHNGNRNMARKTCKY
jgi:hypothetical protein